MNHPATTPPDAIVVHHAPTESSAPQRRPRRRSLRFTYGSTAEDRAAAVERFSAARRRGLTIAQAANAAKVSAPSMWRWIRRLAVGESLRTRSAKQRVHVALRRFGITPETARLLQEHRVGSRCPDARTAIRLTVNDPRCAAEQARLLLPFGRRLARVPIPEWLERFLAVKEVHLLKRECGDFTVIRRTGRSRGGIHR
jgi:hypothetical protein